MPRITTKYIVGVIILIDLLLFLEQNTILTTAFTSSLRLNPGTFSRTKESLVGAPLFAKRRKNQQAREDLEKFNSWYDDVSSTATPDDIFWEEMERQKWLQSSSSVNGGNSGSSSSSSPSLQNEEMRQEMSDERTIEVTLAKYSKFMVDDNWLDDDLLAEMDTEETEDDLESQLEELENDEDYLLSSGDDPWDHWGHDDDDTDSRIVTIKGDRDVSGLLLDYDDDDDVTNDDDIVPDDDDDDDDVMSLSMHSPTLSRAANNPKAATFFSRPPSTSDGLDRLWVSAIDTPCISNLNGVFRNYGIEFALNIGDWILSSSSADSSRDATMASIEDIASFKARKTFEVTGLPCIASRTSFEVEPMPMPTHSRANNNNNAAAASFGNSARVMSGYRFNDVGDHVDEVTAALLGAQSSPERRTRFRSCLCYYDGEMEIFDYGECDVDLYFCNSLRTYIPMSSAINELSNTLQLALGLEYQKWLTRRVNEMLRNKLGAAALKLRDRVLKEGKVLPNDIIDVSAFMDSMVDVELMDGCGKELADRFIDLKPNKILTIATTGLVIAIPMARHLQVPVVYARKERNMVMSNTYQASYSSKTVGKNRELLVSQTHLSKDDRILIVDDFLSGGSSQEALFRIVNQSGAQVVGVGVLMEKVYDSGRKALSGFNVRMESLVRVASVKDGIITLLEEEGFDLKGAL